MKPLTVLVAVLVFAGCMGCVDPRNRSVPTTGSDAPTCQDRDGDGYGEGCPQGGDCNDRDRNVHVGCTRCATPEQGCPCGDGEKPISCYLDPSTTLDGTVMCHDGTRHCRQGQWSACEALVSYPRGDELDTQALIDPNAATQHCNDCTVNCFVVHDNLDPVDAGLDATSTNISSPSGGGLTLTATVPDAGTADGGKVFDPSLCVPGTAPDQDCDGIPDMYDPYPLQKPFATANPALFLDIAPGETGTGVVNLEFYLNSADVYFLVDQTGSMAGERDQLKADLVTGDFVNDASFQCADYDFDRQPNNELKSQGIIGAIRCKIRDANFGVGYFREIPLYYANADNVTYRNMQDITADIPSVVSAVSLLDTVGNNDWPEASALALYAVATGNGFYFGMDRTGLAPRTDCPSLSYGYPCFRQSAIPIVVMFTDAQFHQGPSNNDYPYSSSRLGINSGTTPSYLPVSPTNESYASARDLGDLTNAYLSLIGNTQSMTSDFGVSEATCGSSDDHAPDAMFKFTLSSTKTLSASTLGSDFDTTLSIFQGVPTPVTNLPAYPNTNDTAANAYQFNTVNNKYVQASGDSSSLAHDYSANDVGCGAAADGEDATFTFNLSQATRVALSSSGSSYGSSLALFSGAPVQNSYTTIPNTNDDAATAYVVGNLNGHNRGYAGDTSAAGITATYTGSQLNCGSAPADGSPDAVYDFSLSQATRVRVSAEDSALDTVLALTNADGVYLGPSYAGTSNETQGSAYDVGAMDNAAFQFTGNTSYMHADYPGSVTGCYSGDSSNDAVFKFTLAATQTLQIDTEGSGYDTSLSLFRGSISGSSSSSVYVSSNNNETMASAYNLGTLDGKSLYAWGGSTYYMSSDYSSTQVGCGSSSSSNDAVFKFHLNSATRVQVDTSGSSFDNVASLHGAQPTQSITSVANTNEAVASALSVNTGSSAPYQSFDGSTGSMAADVAINQSASCTSEYAARDAVYRLNVQTAGTYELNTIGSAFDTVLALYPSTVSDAAPPGAVSKGTAGDKKSSAINVGALDSQWLSFTGNTSTLAADNSFSSCSAKATSPDVYYSFTLNSRRSVVIDTIGSSFDTVLALTDSSDSLIACNNDSVGTASQITSTLDPGTYYVFIKGYSSSGAYQITFRDSAVSTVSNVVACDDNSGGSYTSKITQSLSVGTYYVVVKGRTSSAKGNYRFTVKDLDIVDTANRLACDDNSAGGGDALFQADLAAGDYYVIVKGAYSSARGSYKLQVSDIGNTSGFVACNDDYIGLTSRITQTLSAGTYYVVVRGYSWRTGSYTLTLRDTDVALATTYACDYNSGPSGTSLIEQDLAAGNYRVVVKGKNASDKGPYKLILRDLGQVPTGQLACNNGYIEQDLSAGTYTVVMQSTSSGGAGNYQLSVRDASQISGGNALLCDNDSGTASTSKLSQALSAGTYYALVKGDHSADKGLYQLNIGAGSTSSGQFVPPTWTETRDALNAKSIRVIPVLSCHDDPQHGDWQGDCVATRSQATALANATDALGSNLQPLVFDIDGDGSGLSKTVVDGIGQLADYLEMNVSVRVVFEPDPNPGFGLTVRAVDSAGDGCSGVIGLEHQRCVPGATPRFELVFENPAGSPVPSNPSDPNGGYNFRAELIGDSQFIVDRVPIYIIPHDLSPPQPDPVYAPSGSYWQDVSSSGCTGTQRPDWHDLTWNADIPDGTSVAFAVCASEDLSVLGNCTPTQLCTVTGGAACTSDSDCTDGYCSSAHNCQFVAAGSCTTDDDCSRGAACRSGTCRFTGQPVYIGDALAINNYTSNLRMQIGLTANTGANTAPTVYDWSLTYVCNSAQ